MAFELGATAAKVIPADEILVENRVVLKCRVGYKEYGKTLMCPPYAPSVDEFRKIKKREVMTNDLTVSFRFGVNNLTRILFQLKREI